MDSKIEMCLSQYITHLYVCYIHISLPLFCYLTCCCCCCCCCCWWWWSSLSSSRAYFQYCSYQDSCC